jgi:hypothetical protein
MSERRAIEAAEAISFLAVYDGVDWPGRGGINFSARHRSSFSLSRYLTKVLLARSARRVQDFEANSACFVLEFELAVSSILRERIL